MHCKEGQVLLQIGTGLMHALKRRASIVTNWDRFDACVIEKVKCYYRLEQVCSMNYKEGQVLLQSGTVLIYAF